VGSARRLTFNSDLVDSLCGFIPLSFSIPTILPDWKNGRKESLRENVENRGGDVVSSGILLNIPAGLQCSSDHS